MKTVSISFIGGGRITMIMLQAFKNQHIDFKSIVICDINPDILTNIKHQFPEISITDSVSAAASQEIVFLALHPPMIMDVLDSIKDDISRETTIISLAPKISINLISGRLNQTNRILRLIPNATSIINEGFNPVSFASDYSVHEKNEILDLLKVLGKTFEVEESKLEGYAILSAMLPTYFWFQMRELVSIGATIGLTDEESRHSVRESLMAAIKTFFDSGLNPDEVMDLIPVKPIGEYEDQIVKCYQDKLVSLHNKIKSC